MTADLAHAGVFASVTGVFQLFGQSFFWQ